MATYQDPEMIVLLEDPLFEKTFPPGTITPHSGIYRCASCIREIASAHPQPLPLANHHQHHGKQGPIGWRLIVATNHR
jgi:hypothetical protein